MKSFSMILAFAACLGSGFMVFGQQKEPTQLAVAAAREKGLDWLTKNQAKDGSWAKPGIPITSFACLSYLAASEETLRRRSWQGPGAAACSLPSEQAKRRHV